jgi:uncharacterized protein (DUF1684 family)
VKNPLTAWFAALMTAVFLSFSGAFGDDFDASAHENEVLEWRAWRLEQLKKPTGFLNQTGLFWLQPGSYRFGSAAGNDLLFGSRAVPEIGIFEVTDAGVRMIVRDGVDVRSDGVAVADMLIPADTSGEDVIVSHGSLAWTVIEREGRFAVRLRDFEHPFVESFGPLPYFDIDPSMRVQATLHRYEQPRIANVDTVIEGLDYNPESPGMVEFEIGGVSYELEAYSVGGQLYFVFGDLTNRDATYGAGRFLYAPLPGENGLTVLDFNKAYSPPCAFNDFSTCPVASPRNRLPIRIEAGEKYELSLHYSPEH